MPPLITQRHVTVLGLEMAVTEAGQGRPMVLLHGNPTSSWLWRHSIPRLAPLGRVIAPDLIGMGRSARLSTSGPNAYRFVDHRRYLDALLAELGVDDGAVVVGHDWGGALGFDWSRRHESAVAGIAYMETIVRPRSWSDEPPEGRRLFEALRSPAGERMVLGDNIFIEEILTGGTTLTAAELAIYRAPYLAPGEDRRPMLTWAREIPFDGEPNDVDEIVEEYSRWLMGTSVPKLFVAAEPGAIIVGEARSFCERLPNQRIVVVESGHFVPEDAPGAVADALYDWIVDL